MLENNTFYGISSPGESNTVWVSCDSSVTLTYYAQWQTTPTVACKHPSYDSSGYCTSCKAEFQINVTAMPATTFYAVKDDVPVRARPYAPNTILKNLSKGTAVTVVGSGYNSVGNLWYKLNDGNWIFSDNLTKTAPPSTPAPIQKPSPPTNLTAKKIGSTRDAQISWSAGAGATSYEVEWSTANSNGWRTVNDYKTKTATSFTSYGHDKIVFKYRVRSVNSAGVSSWVECSVDMR